MSAAHALEARWYSDVASTALDLGKDRSALERYYLNFGSELADIFWKHCQLSNRVLLPNSPSSIKLPEVSSLLDFVDEREKLTM